MTCKISEQAKNKLNELEKTHPDVARMIKEDIKNVGDNIIMERIDFEDNQHQLFISYFGSPDYLAES